jgi:hypothetical protein
MIISKTSGLSCSIVVCFVKEMCPEYKEFSYYYTNDVHTFLPKHKEMIWR